MPLVVSSLTGDTSNVFDWILSLNPENAQGLTTLLQMLREHYCVQGAEKYNRESLPEASGGCHRLFNKGRYLREQLGQRLEG